MKSPDINRKRSCSLTNFLPRLAWWTFLTLQLFSFRNETSNSSCLRSFNQVSGKLFFHLFNRIISTFLCIRVYSQIPTASLKHYLNNFEASCFLVFFLQLYFKLMHPKVIGNDSHNYVQAIFISLSIKNQRHGPFSHTALAYSHYYDEEYIVSQASLFVYDHS